MQTPGYELLYIVSSIKNDNEVKTVISAVNEILTKFEATIIQNEQWSKRKLEYKIRGIEHGTYILAYFTVNESALSQIATALKHTADLTRSIIIKHTNIASAKSAFFDYYQEIKNKRRPMPHIRYTPQPHPMVRPVQHTRLEQAPVKQPSQPLAIVEEKIEMPQIATKTEKLESIDELSEKTTPQTDEPSAKPSQQQEEEQDHLTAAPPQKSEETIQEGKAPTKTSSRHSKPLHRKPVKKPTLAELDTKLKQILEGEIEL